MSSEGVTEMTISQEGRSRGERGFSRGISQRAVLLKTNVARDERPQVVFSGNEGGRDLSCAWRLERAYGSLIMKSWGDPAPQSRADGQGVKVPSHARIGKKERLPQR